MQSKHILLGATPLFVSSPQNNQLLQPLLMLLHNYNHLIFSFLIRCRALILMRFLLVHHLDLVAIQYPKRYSPVWYR